MQIKEAPARSREQQRREGTKSRYFITVLEYDFLLSLHMDGWMEILSTLLLWEIMSVPFVFLRYNLAVVNTTSQQFEHSFHMRFVFFF